MNETENFLFEKASSELIEQIFKKIQKITQKHGHEIGYAVFANVGQLTLGSALSAYAIQGDDDLTKDMYKKMCDAIWTSSEHYKMQNKK
jgi:hypothetical protein